MKMLPAMSSRAISRAFLMLTFSLATLVAAQLPASHAPGRRVLLDAHNAYPYQGRWTDRVDRALATGLPLAIEQDLLWRAATATLPAQSIVSHDEPFTNEEPTLRAFFERIRPIATRALAAPSREDWPLVTLNLDFKDNYQPHLAAIWSLLGEYEEWLTTAPRVGAPDQVEALRVGPVLVLTGSDSAQEAVFHDAVPIGARLRVFGAILPTVAPNGARAPRQNGKTNYRRWSNNPWSVVEPEGQNKAGEWIPQDAERLQGAVRAAHDAGLWIRFYTLNGHSKEDGERMGWTASYNFGSLEAVRIRWRAAIAAGVDFVATDQYEEFAQLSSR
jgi:hypothetical protein